jgi:predicted restriction endonuclease
MTFDNMSIEEAISRSRQKYSEANKYQLIRANALRRMKSLGIERKCVKCGYSFHVEVAHIKGISEFAKIDKIGEVNGIGNLVYLCRNHHYELDKGHFTL